MKDIKDLFDLFKKIERLSGPPEFVIAGLGNPGQDYQRTRHNTGFMALDRVAAACHVKTDRLKFRSLSAQAELGGHRVLLLKPSTFMNNSGEAVRDALAFYKLDPQHLIVVYDDTTLALGKLRIRRKGGDGGHNGIKSILYQTGSDQFPRVKIGIGERPNPRYDLADWVLSKYSDADLALLSTALDSAVAAIVLIMDGKIEEAMAKYN